MKKNLFDHSAIEATISRVLKLDSSSSGRWGSMNVTEMLHHCNLCNEQILEGQSVVPSRTSLKQWFVRLLSLYVVPAFPKNMKGAEENDTKNKVSGDSFETEREKFIGLMLCFDQFRGAVQITHPAFGRLNTRQWGRAAWMHMDHHLRQFGV